MALAIDTSVPGSPGWWMLHMWQQLRAERPRLDRLDAYRRGEPPVVMGVRSDRLRSAYGRFQNMSRSNFADLIVCAMTNRMSVRSIRTSAADDDNGDEAAWRIWRANGLDVWQTDLYRSMGTFGVGYTAVGSPTEPDGEPVVTVEDPRQMVTVQDPLRPWRSVAAFKVFHDVQRRMDYAVLWLPGVKWVAQRSRRARVAVTAGGVGGLPTVGGARAGGAVPVAFTPSGFDMIPLGERAADGSWSWLPSPDVETLPPADFPDSYDGITSEQYEMQRVPVVRYGNRDGVGEFELHTDLLDGIIHNNLQGLVIATLQAFKQRALKSSVDAEPLPEEDKNGNPIDYNAVFEADPGALWELPSGYEIWESGQVDLNGILGQSKHMILNLAAASQTPFPMFSPDSANQSANGASLYREGLTFKVEDRCRIAGDGHAQLISLCFEIKGDTKRSDPADVIIDWAPADRYSILEMAQADAQSSLPMQQKAARIYGMSPAEVKIVMGQAAQQSLMAAALAPKPPTAPPAPAPTPPAGPSDAAAG